MAILKKLKYFFRENRRGSRRITEEKTSVLSEDLIIQGDVFGDGEIYLDGGVNGNVSCEKLNIGRGGFINGQIECKKAEIHGEVAGSISATDVVLAETAQVHGDVSHQTLSVHSGAVVDGYYMQNDINVPSKSGSTMPYAGMGLSTPKTRRPKQKRIKKSPDNPLSTATSKTDGYSRKTVH